MLDRREGRFRGGGWASGSKGDEILRCGLKCVITCPPGRVPRLGYASLVANERKMPRLWLVQGGFARLFS